MGISTIRLPQNYHHLCESEREKKVHNDRGGALSIGKGNNGSIVVIFMVFTADY